jgi:RimJ/RimL family protein N-acetyltransferase
MIFDQVLMNETLQLKSLDPRAHAKKITGWLSDPYLNKYLVVRHKEITEVEEIKHIESLNTSPKSYYFGIFHRVSAELIGTTTCRIKNTSTLEIGILIGEVAFHGKGFGGSALTLLETFAQNLKLEKISAGIECDNDASVALFSKMGYEFESDTKINEFGTKCFQVSKDIPYGNV